MLRGCVLTLCACLAGCGQADLEGYSAISAPEVDPLERPGTGAPSDSATEAGRAPAPDQPASPPNRTDESPADAMSTVPADMVTPAASSRGPRPGGVDVAAPPEVARDDAATDAAGPRDGRGSAADAAPPLADPALAPASASQSPADGSSGQQAAGVATMDQMVATPQPGGIRLLIPEQSFVAEGPQGAQRISYDDLDLLKVLNMEPVPVDAERHFPDWLRNLDGQRIRVRGFMYPPFEETGIEMFLLARDNQICCFGRNPKIYDIMPVTMRDGQTTNYIQNRPFDVVGTFHIRPEQDGNELYQLYLIDDAVVID